MGAARSPAGLAGRNKDRLVNRDESSARFEGIYYQWNLVYALTPNTKAVRELNSFLSRGTLCGLLGLRNILQKCRHIFQMEKRMCICLFEFDKLSSVQSRI